MVDSRLRDVADRAGVSMATASYVLRSSPGARISPETRARVRLAADEVGYRWRAPHRISGAVVLVVPEHTERVAPGLVAAVTEQSWARGLATVLLPGTGATGTQAAAALRDEGLRAVGVVEIAHGEHDDAYGDQHDDRRADPPPRRPAQTCEPTVVVDLANRSPVPAEDRTVVVPDDRQAARQIAGLLRRAGHDSVALVTDDRHAHLVALWRDGLAEVVRRQVPVIEHTATSARGAPGPLRHGLHHADWPTALICLAEPRSTLVEHLAGEARHLVAGDLAVVVRGGGGGPDGLEHLRVHFPVTELARAALGALDRSGVASGTTTRVGQVNRVRFPAESFPQIPLPVSHVRLHTVGEPAPAV
jgi:LacI family transcriptional regulator